MAPRRHVEMIAGLESRPTRSLLCVSSRSVCDHRYCSTCALFVSKSSLRSLSAALSASIRLLAALADAVPGGTGTRDRGRARARARGRARGRG